MPAQTLNKEQVRLLQTAVRAAGLRAGGQDGRYRLLLGQYRRSNGQPATSCKDLDGRQMEDLLAICESMGWRMPGKPADYFRIRASLRDDVASYAQQAGIRHLANDLGWDGPHLANFIKRQTAGRCDSVERLGPTEAYVVIEGLKAIVSRGVGRLYNSLAQVRDALATIVATVKRIGDQAAAR